VSAAQGLHQPPLLLVAHGTRDAAGAEVALRLAERVRRRLPGSAVRLAFVDVRPPTVAHIAPTLRRAAEVVVLPAFLAAGYHVRRDLPAQLAAAGLVGRTRLTPVLGADPRLVAAAEDRLRDAGWRPAHWVAGWAARYGSATWPVARRNWTRWWRKRARVGGGSRWPAGCSRRGCSSAGSTTSVPRWPPPRSACIPVSWTPW